MKKIKIYISKFIVLVMALQILNLSIDTQNFQPPEPKNTLTYFNEMNSVVEFVTEKLITKRDTFPENKSQNGNNNNSQLHKHTSINTFFPLERFPEKINTSACITYNCFLPVAYSFIYTEIQSPPPKTAIINI